MESLQEKWVAKIILYIIIVSEEEMKASFHFDRMSNYAAKRQ